MAGTMEWEDCMGLTSTKFFKLNWSFPVVSMFALTTSVRRRMRDLCILGPLKCLGFAAQTSMRMTTTRSVKTMLTLMIFGLQPGEVLVGRRE